MKEYLSFYDCKTGNYIKSIPCSETIIGRNFSSDGRYFACCDKSGKELQLWDLSTLKLTRKVHLTNTADGVCFSSNDKYIYVYNSDDLLVDIDIDIYEVGSLHRLQTIHNCPSAKDNYNSDCFIQSFGDDEDRNKDIVKIVFHDKRPAKAIETPHMTHFIVGLQNFAIADEKELMIYRINTGKVVYQVKLNGEPSDMLFSNTDKFILLMFENSNNIMSIDLENHSAKMHTLPVNLNSSWRIEMQKSNLFVTDETGVERFIFNQERNQFQECSPQRQYYMYRIGYTDKAQLVKIAPNKKYRKVGTGSIDSEGNQMKSYKGCYIYGFSPTSKYFYGYKDRNDLSICIFNSNDSSLVENFADLVRW